MTLKELVDELTLEEKAKLLEGIDAWCTAPIERLGIPSIWVADGPHGLRKQVSNTELSPESGNVQAVCFPSASGLAASFNRGVFAKLGETLADECLAEDVNIILGPAINIKRSPLCGRNFEYISEDPYLTGQLASAYVKGVQTRNVGVSVKHFAANNQEKRRMTIDDVIDERTLREIYLSAFEEVVKTAHPDSLMCSYNAINSVHSSENPWLLKKVLREEWGFDGFVMSDWGAVYNRPLGVEAGLDLQMPSSGGIDSAKVVAAVQNGKLDAGYVDIAVTNILEKVDKYKGIPLLHENDADTQSEKVVPEFNRVEDHKKAHRVARECMVLLKNESMLPLNPSQKILFVGEFAVEPRYQGCGSSRINPTKVTSPLAAARRITDVKYVKGFSATQDKEDDKLIKEAIAAAKRANVTVVFAGLPDSFESEGFDRSSLNLPNCQNRLIRELAAVTPNLIVCLQNGSPVTMPWINEVDAVLECYLAGEACGEATADILFGKTNPSGKLAETFPLSIKDTPCYENFPGGQRTVEYREAIYVGYRYYDKVNQPVLFPFGHGLSYTTFEYSDLTVNNKVDSVEVKFRLKNTGDRAGAEVAQIYVGKPTGNVFRAMRELKGFEKVFLKPGEEQEVDINLSHRSFAYYSLSTGKWCVEPGIYTICVGASSRDIRLRGVVSIESEYDDIYLLKPDEIPTYFFGDPKKVSDEEFTNILCHPIPAADFEEGYEFTCDNSLDDVKNTKWGGVLYKIATLACKGRSMHGSSDMFLTGVTESPLRNYFAMSRGLFSEESAHAMMELINNRDVADNLKLLAKNGIDLVKEKLGV